jgi:hypothetical protein
VFPYRVEVCEMPILINESITVHEDKDLKPTAFIWRKRLYRITGILNWWREPCKWWDGQRISLVIRVIATNRTAGNYTLRKVGKGWYMYQVLD